MSLYTAERWRSSYRNSGSRPVADRCKSSRGLASLQKVLRRPAARTNNAMRPARRIFGEGMSDPALAPTRNPRKRHACITGMDS